MSRITPDSKNWPGELAHIDPSPDRLWLRGREEFLSQLPRVAIVGSRAPTPYGQAQARRFAQALAQAGIVIVSGLARGIDAAAHEGALDAGGATIGILGCGVDKPWPAGPLAERMAEEGLLMSEFPPGVGPRKHHFPLRNRLISALASAVVVIEAAHASGSLITAHWAADQGRPVFALPGRVDHPMARGCHRLIREGAQLVESPSEVLAEVGFPQLPFGDDPREQATRDPIESVLVGETLTSNELAAKLRLTPQELLPRLAELELQERLVRAPGGLWRLP